MNDTERSQQSDDRENQGAEMARPCACQIYSLNRMSRITAGELLLQPCKRLKRIVKRRWRYLVNLLCRRTGRAGNAEGTARPLHSGDIVRVKSWEEIAATLDRWNQLKKCAFMEEMREYCGTTQRVRKRVERFLDERDYHTKTCRGIVILENVMCRGTRDFGRCDRSCFFFWREEWLERIPGESIMAPEEIATNCGNPAGSVYVHGVGGSTGE